MAKRICMYCKKVFGTVAGDIDSHGVCDRKECREKFKRDQG